MNGPSDPDEFDRLRAAARERMRLIRDEQERLHREIAEGDGRARPDPDRTQETKP